MEYDADAGTETYYTYDNGGNILNRNVLDADTYDEINDVNYVYGDSEWKDLLTEYDGTAITYDAIGNPLSYRGMAMTWQRGRQLASITKDGSTISYQYDSSGLRTRKSVGGVTTKYFYKGSTLIAQTNGTHEMSFHYDGSGTIAGFTYDDDDYYYKVNSRGDVLGIYDDAGASVCEYSYDVWGRLLSATGSDAGTIGTVNPIRYRGYYYDAETGLYYVSSRYYAPETCRFINADSQLNTDALLGYNLFAYCENNPVNKVDPTGHMVTEAAVAATNWWNPAGWIAAAILVVEVVVVVVAVCAVVDETAQVVQETVEAADNIVNTRDQSVYTLTDPNDGNKVKYVGRTNNPERRAKEHKKNPSKTNYEMTVVATGLNLPEAKVAEQALISAYTLSYLDNARREIAVGNLSGFKSNMDSVIQIFGSVTEDELMNLMGR